MKIAIICVFAACLIDVSMVSSQLITPRSCSDFGVVPMNNFDKTQYAGQWFMHQNYDFTNEENYNCYIQIRTPLPDGNQNITEILVNPGLEPEIDNAGLTTFDMPGLGHYIYSSPLFPGTQSYYILSTDYDNYAMESSCKTVSSGSSCYLFIMSRLPVVTAATQSTIDAVITHYQFNTTTLRTLNITSCPAQLLQVPGGDGLLERVLQIVDDLVEELLGGLLGLLG